MKKIKDITLRTLKILTAHESENIRESVIYYYSLLSKEVLKQDEIATHVLPSIIILTSDKFKKVRIATIKCFGELAKNTSDENTLEKLRVQFATMLGVGSSRKRKEELVDTLGTIILEVTKTFRENCIIKELVRLTKENSGVSENKKKRMISHLFPSFVILSQCNDLSNESLQTILEALEIIRRDQKLLSIEAQTKLNQLVLIYKSKIY